MPVWLRPRFAALAAILVVALVGALFGPRRSNAAPVRVAPHAAAAPAGDATVITVEPGVSGNRIAQDFLGLSFEYWAASNYAGQDPGAVDPVLVQLVHNLMPAGGGSLRIAGVTTDWTWWPVRGLRRPGGVNYNLNTQRLEVLRALARAVGARLILGLNFEADSATVATAEERAMLKVIGRRRIAAFELGNEPELYSSFPWYRTANGAGVVGRPAGWDFATFNSDYAQIARALGRVPLAGPTAGTLPWVNLPQFIATEPQLALVALHRYPLVGCFNPTNSPTYPTLGNLLSDSASSGLADSLAPFAITAHDHGLKLRNDEMNSVSCGPGNGVADVFGSALWALDALFQMARAGVDGVNIHTAPTYPDRLFVTKRVHSRWQAVVQPEYYGLLMFARAAPGGSRLLQVSGASGGLRAWATRGRDRRIRVVVINDDTAHAQRLTVQVPGARGKATIERLEASSVHAKTGVTLGGRSFGALTTTGQLSGPKRVLLAPHAGSYDLRLPAASAAMLTLSAS